MTVTTSGVFFVAAVVLPMILILAPGVVADPAVWAPAAGLLAAGGYGSRLSYRRIYRT
ncbi:hypothetical protein [Streptomyces sp. NPDC097619]|uniref:hypothetical protein n=1 Tax=Streptomyces sp. NPDC097619 TaxID=3157228 RepID=UPI0033204945